MTCLPGLYACEGGQTITVPVPTSARGHALGGLPKDAAPGARAALRGGYASTLDEHGAPRLLTATSRVAAPAGLSPEQRARWHLRRFHGQAPGAAARLHAVHEQSDGGQLVHLRQHVGGVEVYGGDLKIALGPDGELRSLSGAPAPTRLGPSRARFRLDPPGALAAALSHRFGMSVPAERVRGAGNDSAGFQRHALAAQDVPFHVSESRSKPVYYRLPGPEGGRLIPAYFVEFYASADKTSSDSDALRYLIAADDGRVLERHDLKAYDFQYRVFARPDGDKRPFDGPQADFTPHPTGRPDGSKPAFITPNLVTVQGLNQNPQGQPDPWLPSGALQSSGNNVDAYTDQLPPDGYSNGDLRATPTAPGVFDRSYDLLAEPVASAAQSMAGVTQLFYNVNWLHDDWYGAGFNEAAGNAQVNNYGRGGADGDPIRAEDQDNFSGGSRNNANMSTPADGMSPRMQMYVWSGADTRKLTLSHSAQPPAFGVAAFGPKGFNVSGDVILADDGAAPLPSDACQPITNNVAGKVALIDRGNCTFKTKALAAQTAGAVAVLIANNAAGTTPPGMADDATITTPITIPTVSLIQTEGAALKAALTTQTVRATLSRSVEADRDGGLENQVIAHEWGHYLHHRLSDCSGTTQCGAMSEGWADFVALHMTLRPGDNLDGVYANAIYASVSFGDAGYFGIRRFPYSVNPAQNALSFRHIQTGEALPAQTPQNPNGISNAEVHNAGEVWASMLWEAYVALHKAPRGRSFTEVQRAMQRYVVAGLQLAPRNATYTETRDALLAAIAARSMDDLAVVAQAFARRGAGTCAQSPPRESTDLKGVVESTTLQPRAQIGALVLSDGGASCDQDGILDRRERGKLSVTVSNGGPAPLTDAVLTLKPDGKLTLAATSLKVPTVAPYGSTTLTVDASPAGELAPLATTQIAVELRSANSCAASTSSSATFRVNFDDRAAISASDDVESARPAWTRSGEGAAELWERAQDQGMNHVWQGSAAGSLSDTALVSPPLSVSKDQPLIIQFEHAYSFEADLSGQVPVFYDGAVIEVSADGGATWQDVSTYADAGYGGEITTVSNNPLGKRRGFVAQSEDYPKRQPVTLNLGTKLAGKSVLLRFRIGTDEASGDLGWTLDNLAVRGITNTPFGALVADAGRCPAAPTAVAGERQSVASGAMVLLNASASKDENGDALTFAWKQIAGPSVALVSATGALTGFTAPVVRGATTLTFQVDVSDGVFTSSSTVEVVVQPAVLHGGGCSAAPQAPRGAHGAALLAAALALALARRRRARP